MMFFVTSITKKDSSRRKQSRVVGKAHIFSKYSTFQNEQSMTRTAFACIYDRNFVG
jgi:hypothetical protein